MSKFFKWVFPSLLLICLAPWSRGIDLRVSSCFYDSHSLSHRPFSENPIFYFAYHYGTIPAYFAGIGSLFLFLASFKFKKLLSWKKPCLFLFTSFLLSISIVNIIKGSWPRPRPVQTEIFGGFAPFCPFYVPLNLPTPEPCQSMPSGHTMSGMAFMAFCFLGLRLQKRWMVQLGFFLVLALGFGLLFTRLALGAHYLTDTLMSSVIVWYSCLICDKMAWKRRMPPLERTD